MYLGAILFNILNFLGKSFFCCLETDMANLARVFCNFLFSAYQKYYIHICSPVVYVQNFIVLYTYWCKAFFFPHPLQLKYTFSLTKMLDNRLFLKYKILSPGYLRFSVFCRFYAPITVFYSAKANSVL